MTEPLRHRQPWTRPEIFASVSCVVALAAMVGTIANSCASHKSAAVNQAQYDETKLNQRIDSRIQSSTKLDTVIEKLNGISERLSRLEGWKEGIESRVSKISKEQGELKQHVSGQQALAKLVNPNRVLATIRAELSAAGEQSASLPRSQVLEYKNAVKELPPSTNAYWATVAAIINYQSLLDQLSGEAPDPAKVSHPCAGLTTSKHSSSYGNTFTGAPIANCVVDLDRETFIDDTFVDCVVRYHNGPTMLRNVQFINCRFILDPPPTEPSPQQVQLLQALLDAQSQTRVRLTT